MVNLDGRGVNSRASKGNNERLKALEVTIYDLRSNECDKNWQNFDKSLQVRNVEMPKELEKDSLMIL